MEDSQIDCSQLSQDAFDTLPDGSDVDEPVLIDEPPPAQKMPAASSEDRSATSGNSRNSVWRAPNCFPGPRGIQKPHAGHRRP
eukprot:11785954-Alexandrium_andersonii.AAC.1